MRLLHPIVLLIPMFAVSVLAAPGSLHADEALLFISNFAGGDDGAIQAASIDLKSGTLKLGRRTTGVENPFFLAVSKDHRFLYSIHAKDFGSKADEQVAAFQIVGRTGELKRLNSQSTRGSASCYLEVDATGKTVMVANYATGSVAAFPVKGDGSLEPAATFVQHTGQSVNPSRQKGAFAHSIIVSPDNRFAFAADLGIDKILIYELRGDSAKLTPHRQPFVRTIPGSGPRHLTFHPNGRHLYAINELSNTVTRFDYLPDTGMLVEQETLSTLPLEADKAVESYCADVKITPNGKFLYGTNRGHDSLACYRLGDDGRLTLTEIVPSLGKGPQNLAIAPGGEFLLCANMPGNNVAVFRIDPQTGKLTAVGEPIPTKSPSCIMVVHGK